ADALLATEGLSDCRLDVERPGSIPDGTPLGNLGRWLGFDTAVNDDAKGNVDWESVVTRVLSAFGHGSETGTIALHEDGRWQHGLLTGHASGGTARFIGKANRMRVRQRELDELQERWTKLDEELRWLNNQIAEYEQRRTQVQEKQAQLHKVLTQSGLEDLYNKLASAKAALDEARGKYQMARLQTQEARQNYNTITAQLERETHGALASDLK